MNNKLLLLTFGIFILGLTSAIYAGESMVVSNPSGNENLVWTIVDNTSVLSVLPLVTINSVNITIQIPNDMPPNTFTMVFLENQTNTIVQTIQVSSGSGGGYNTITKYVNNTVYVPTIEYVPNTTIQYIQNNTNTNVPITTNKIPLWVGIIFGVLLICLIISLIVLRNEKSKEYIELEGGKDNGE